MLKSFSSVEAVLHAQSLQTYHVQGLWDSRRTACKFRLLRHKRPLEGPWLVVRVLSRIMSLLQHSDVLNAPPPSGKATDGRMNVVLTARGTRCNERGARVIQENQLALQAQC